MSLDFGRIAKKLLNLASPATQGEAFLGRHGVLSLLCCSYLRQKVDHALASVATSNQSIARLKISNHDKYNQRNLKAGLERCSDPA